MISPLLFHLEIKCSLPSIKCLTIDQSHLSAKNTYKLLFAVTVTITGQKAHAGKGGTFCSVAYAQSW